MISNELFSVQSGGLVNCTGTTTPSQIGASDLNRVLTSGYINGEENMGYMKRAGDHIASHMKSPQFHRPSKSFISESKTINICRGKTILHIKRRIDPSIDRTIEQLIDFALCNER